ncbi:threonine aldolase family protein [Actinomadura madurae]|uniref:threonine aldolase family protein n=1 Tax=Actinomadura madurae TaxID=1993 RepID=UPI0020D24D78|nr:beta-eliminating lyase-related protein [Actinomadura madurae]MCP9951476.1 beta-eliminating lyase-related protein [Actinomadura madurae]MCP9968249.1 beta-eliminating lyase-related protein [Actinomadura madurae]MCQ0007783.1 beta-eliminating lyase-related protein [Actinomadura madurae]MCQ0016906.1 beta-eliminating lyase-related protein [Actinomadura madurae]
MLPSTATAAASDSRPHTEPIVDLRSDSSSLPSTEMLRAMQTARLGNDLYGEDPTANELEAAAARLLGKDSAVLMPSGVMANKVALSVLAEPDQLIAVGRLSHINLFEDSLPQRLLLPVDDSDEERFAEHLWSARDQVVALALENTHLMREGHVMTPEAAVRFARIGVPVHLDGARLMNAAAALEVPPADLAACATTVTLTLSKGLGAPIGSVLAGPEEVMNRARQSRLAMGGSLAQAGVVAAAGLVALRRPPEEFRADHRRAARIRAAAEERWPGSTSPRTAPGTNIVIWSPPEAPGVLARLADRGIHVLPWGETSIRAVTHPGISEQDIDHVVDAIGAM